MHLRPPSLSPKKFALLLLLAFTSYTSPALAAPFAFLTGGSVDFVTSPFRFASGSAIDSEGNAFTFGWIPLFIQGRWDVSGASSSWVDSDVSFGTATIQGHAYPDCASTNFPGSIHPTPCVFVQAGMAISGPAPPFTPGDSSTVIAGSFTVGLDATIFSDRLGGPIDSFHRGGSGRAVITLMKNSSGDNWLFQSATGVIDPVPEPTTLLLLGSTFAGVSLARRRYGREPNASRSLAAHRTRLSPSKLSIQIASLK
jgi:hypothetical protein